MNWEDVAKLEPIKLNLGGFGDCHPKPPYEGFVAVDMDAREEWSVRHDLSQPFPLPDGSVSQILSEHCFEHLEIETVKSLLAECHRMLKPGGWLRFAVPDYGSPRNQKYRQRGHDPKHLDHVNFPVIEDLRSYVEESPFRTGRFYDYWENGEFVPGEVDDSKGFIKRTRKHDPRNSPRNGKQRLDGAMRGFLYRASRGFMPSPQGLSVLRYHPLRITSIVVDLEK